MKKLLSNIILGLAMLIALQSAMAYSDAKGIVATSEHSGHFSAVSLQGMLCALVEDLSAKEAPIKDQCPLDECKFTADRDVAVQAFSAIAVGFGNMGGYPDWYGGNYICANNNLHLGVVQGSGIKDAPGENIFLYPVKHSYKDLYELQLDVESKRQVAKERGVNIVHVFVDDVENDVQVGMVELDDRTKKAFRRYVSNDERIRLIQEPYEQELE